MQLTEKKQPSSVRDEVEAVIIPIDVIREGALSPFLSGTFSQPPALVRVRKDTRVKWQLNEAQPGDAFIVSFPHGSPFADATAASDRTEAMPAVNVGNFHYQVFVSDGATGVVYAIRNCPELEVDSD
jgi:hypothetical protein